MGRGYRSAQGDSWDPLVKRLKTQDRRLSGVEKASGTSLSSLVKQVQTALANITTTVTDAINLLSMTTAAIRALVAAPPFSVAVTGDVSATGDVTASGGVSAGGMVAGVDVTASGRVTSAAAIRSAGSRAYIVTTDYAASWWNGDGTGGISPSSIRFKTDIAQWMPEDPKRILRLRAVLYRYDHAVLPDADPDAPLQLGFIAEELDALGFSEFVFHDSAGAVEGINYDRITVALLVLGQHQQTQIDSLADRLDAAGF